MKTMLSGEDLMFNFAPASVASYALHADGNVDPLPWPTYAPKCFAKNGIPRTPPIPNQTRW